jgi:hypothetical protein
VTSATDPFRTYCLALSFEGGDGDVGGIERDILSDRTLPTVAVREQTFLIVVEFLGCLGRELEVRSQDDGVDGAGLLTEAAVDASPRFRDELALRRYPNGEERCGKRGSYSEVKPRLLFHPLSRQPRALGRVAS